ncbi:helix-turn-helix domain-containing protein [Chryseobacterium formosus]|uniref:Helix-turn-helix domain-containing protein n=1 Tax=Chryseobacterium formosus TaxID=1537363 RepID=A0ABT3XW52_9FLAO|nr:helix-turn-helix domain-containing protein [Chryseobacterium formosus]MCX8525903.1 helix-turn-helix domain-containing protein [Chryseobacterium formosus]
MMKLILLALFLSCTSALAVMTQDGSFQDIRRNYEMSDTGDHRALPFVQMYIDKAKKERNYEKWVQGYRDGVQFSDDIQSKIKYADSTITVALLSKNKVLIANAYLGKGIIYYFNMKKFQPALEEYLVAQEYAENTDDEYLKNKIVYHIGVVKSYLGFYEEASEHFLASTAFFQRKTKQMKEPVMHYNYKKAYLNCLHQLTVVYRRLGQWKRSDSIIKVGLAAIGGSQDFKLEKAYFFKCRGIAEYHNKNFNASLFYLNKALPQLLKKDDFAWASVAYLYKGNIFWDAGDKEKAIRNFSYIDSVFVKHHFILPEARPVYDKFILYAEETQNLKKERYYTKQLLRVDSFLTKDFASLSSRIHKGYDRKIVLQEKKHWQITKITGLSFVTILLIVALILFYALVKYRRKKNEIVRKYNLLQEKLRTGKGLLHAQENNTENTPKRSALPQEIINDLTRKLSRFEEKEGYRNRGLTLNEMAKELGTNANYLSAFINDTKAMHFKPYLMNLRINYIVNKMNEDRKYLLLTIAALGEEAGFNHRQSFSDAFLEITGLRPAEYIRQQKMKSRNSTED